MSDYRELRKMEEELMEEIRNEKFFSFKRLVKIFELQGVYEALS